MRNKIIKEILEELTKEFGFLKKNAFEEERFEKAIKLTIQKRDEEELEWLGDMLMIDWSNMDKSDIKNLIKLRHIKKLK